MGFLLIVSGLPAAGKTTLAARLGRDMGLPVLHRDRVKAQVFGDFEMLPGATDLVPPATDRLVVATLAMIIDAGGAAILDGNFNTERHMRPVRESVSSGTFGAAEVCL